MAQGVPLHEGQAQGRQCAAQRAGMAVLQALDGQGDVGRSVLHAAIVAAEVRLLISVSLDEVPYVNELMTPPVAAGSLRPTRTYTLDSPVELTLQDRDRTRPFLLLHGGGGVATMAGFADLLAERTHSRVLLPTHPGFGGTPKAETLTNVRDLAQLYATMLEQLELSEVTVLGNSFGGWLAAEIGLLGSPRVRRAVIIDGIGIE